MNYQNCKWTYTNFKKQYENLHQTPAYQKTERNFKARLDAKYPPWKRWRDSLRSSAALLRLALQKLCKQLGEKGENINEDIKNFVKKGLNPQIQKSLDILRITGNNAVHPGEINVEENPELVLKLFGLINFIAEKMITEPKEIEGFYEELPENAKNQIKERDGRVE